MVYLAERREGVGFFFLKLGLEVSAERGPFGLLPIIKGDVMMCRGWMVDVSQN